MKEITLLVDSKGVILFYRIFYFYLKNLKIFWLINIIVIKFKINLGEKINEKVWKKYFVNNGTYDFCKLRKKREKL